MNPQSILIQLQNIRHLVNALEVELLAIEQAKRPERSPDELILDGLLERTADAFRIAPASILSESRNMLLVSARCALVKAAANRGIGWSQLGRFLGKDHSSIIYLEGEYEGRLLRIPEHAKAMQAIVGVETPKAA